MRPASRWSAAARQHQRAFTSADAVVSLVGASFTEPQVLEIARADKLDSISGDAVTLRLIGLSDATVQTLLQRHLQNQPTLSSGEIARLKNAGLTESQVMERINQGMTDEQAEKEVVARREQHAITTGPVSFACAAANLDRPRS